MNTVYELPASQYILAPSHFVPCTHQFLCQNCNARSACKFHMEKMAVRKVAYNATVKQPTVPNV